MRSEADAPAQVERFVETECVPADAVYARQLGAAPAQRFGAAVPAVLAPLQARARAQGLWNLFLPAHLSARSPGFSTLEYGLMAECLGKSRVASEVRRCKAPSPA